MSRTSNSGVNRRSFLKTATASAAQKALTQRLWTSPVPPNVHQDFWTLAYQALEDGREQASPGTLCTA